MFGFGHGREGVRQFELVVKKRMLPFLLRHGDRMLR